MSTARTSLNWQPFDPFTAPKDRKILLWGTSRYCKNCLHLAQYNEGYKNNPGYWSVNGYVEDLSNFTHWAEEPLGPNAE